MMNRPENSLPENSDWSAYKPESFTPNPRSYEVVDVSTTLSPEAEAALRGMITVFKGEAPGESYWQLPRMGRSCFTPVGPEDIHVVSAKGSLGRSAGSESFRQLHEERIRASYAETAGTLSLPVSDEVNFMVMYKPSDNRKPNEPLPEIVFALPEGYSRFSFLLREYRISRELMEPAGVPAPQALALLRREFALPWSTTDGAKQHLNTLFFERHSEVTQLKEGELYEPCDRLDSGLIFRLFKGAVRPHDHYDRALKGKWDELRLAMDASVYTPEETLSQFAVAAGRLAEHGIIHGQLYYDYQNITAGQVCDFELAVVAPSVNPELAARFTAILRRDESQFGVEMMEEYESNLQSVAPDETAANRSLLEQAYYLYDAAVRVVDLDHRARETRGDVPGTVLDEAHIDSLRQLFTFEMSSNMSPRRKRILRDVCRQEIDFDNDFKTPKEGPLLSLLLNHEPPTIYGWSNPSKPFNFYGYRTTKEDIEYIINDFDKFVKALSKSLDQ